MLEFDFPLSLWLRWRRGEEEKEEEEQHNECLLFECLLFQSVAREQKNYKEEKEKEKEKDTYHGRQNVAAFALDNPIGHFKH